MGVALTLFFIISIPTSLRKFLVCTFLVSLDVSLWRFEIKDCSYTLDSCRSQAEMPEVDVLADRNFSMSFPSAAGTYISVSVI